MRRWAGRRLVGLGIMRRVVAQRKESLFGRRRAVRRDSDLTEGQSSAGPAKYTLGSGPVTGPWPSSALRTPAATRAPSSHQRTGIPVAAKAWDYAIDDHIKITLLGLYNSD
ncbi:hypothetical protein BKA62DRAFT_236129 [Auriculariales sp. MPI-PUGE-AT-0066]|nr:hypothetical protein BKA62DRAFT_236129 [Auriculariales sp. MPI-PUGE-AT-0066]